MHKNASPKADKSPQTSPEARFTTLIQLDGRSPVPSQFRTPRTFTITRLQSPAGPPDRITPLKERIVREVGYGLSLEGASAADLVKSMQVKIEPVAQKGKVA
jgi:hypothetical protein